MALPVRSAPLPPDIAIHGWAAITVRVAWTLTQTGVRVTPDVLMDARDHVLFHLEPTLDLAAAEDMAERLTTEFILRARHQKTTDQWPQDARMPLSPRWHKALAHGMPALEATLFKQHYGNGVSLPALESSLQVDAIGLGASRGAIRDLLRRLAQEDGLPVEGWSNDRIDRILCRFAAFSEHPSPPLDEVADGCHQEMIRKCPRCERTWRLAQMGVLTSEDLVAPGVIARPEQQVRLLALHFHPDSRAHRMVLAQELQTPWFPLGEDILLIDLKDTDPILELVCLAVELGTPIRDHIRGVVLQGLGRWSPHGLLGPLASEAFPRLRSRPWGQVASIESLPDVIGSPPSSQRWWLAAAGASLAAVCLCWVAFGSSLYPHPAFPLETEFHADDGFQWLSFDVDEAAIVTLVAQNAGQLRVISGPQTPAEKGRFAVGDGSFRLKSSGEALLIVSSKDPIDGLAQHLTSAGSDETPLANLAARIKASSPHSELMMFNP